MIQIEVQNASELTIPDIEWLETCADLAYVGERKASAVLRIVGIDEAQELNRHYRKKHYATNILSFPTDYSEVPDGVIDEEDLGYLGDLAICAEVVTQEANEQKKTADQHWAHMVIHGMLHLQGYDHISEPEASEMEAIEIKLLGELGVPDPYNETKEG